MENVERITVYGLDGYATGDEIELQIVDDEVFVGGYDYRDALAQAEYDLEHHDRRAQYEMIEEEIRYGYWSEQTIANYEAEQRDVARGQAYVDALVAIGEERGLI